MSFYRASGFSVNDSTFNDVHGDQTVNIHHHYRGGYAFVNPTQSPQNSAWAQYTQQRQQMLQHYLPAAIAQSNASTEARMQQYFQRKHAVGMALHLTRGYPPPMPVPPPLNQPRQPEPPIFVPAERVDIGSILDNEATRRGLAQNWRESIVDLLKLLDLDSSLPARQQLAEKLFNGGSGSGFAQKLAEKLFNGGGSDFDDRLLNYVKDVVTKAGGDLPTARSMIWNDVNNL